MYLFSYYQTRCRLGKNVPDCLEDGINAGHSIELRTNRGGQVLLDETGTLIDNGLLCSLRDAGLFNDQDYDRS